MASEFFLRILIGIPVRKAADFDYCQLMEHDSSDKNYIANCSSLTQITPSILPTTYVMQNNQLQARMIFKPRPNQT